MAEVLDLETAKNLLIGWVDDASAGYVGPIVEEEIKESIRRLIKDLSEMPASEPKEEMRIVLSNPACLECGGATIRMKIYHILPGAKLNKGKDTFSSGFRCTMCRHVFSDLRYKVMIQNPCCERLKEATGDESDPTILPWFDEKKKIISWSVGVEGTLAFDDISFCPFCGERLPHIYSGGDQP